MPIPTGRAVQMVTASVVAAVALVCGSAAAYAEGGGGVPNPGPEPVPALPSAGGGQGQCQADESIDPTNGNCVPTMTPVATDSGVAPEAPLRTTQDTTSTEAVGAGADLVPNINGDPCTGYWESTVCFTEDAPAVQPHSTLSTSP